MDTNCETMAFGRGIELPLERYLDLILQERQIEQLYADIESARQVVERKRLQAETERTSITLKYLRFRESSTANSRIPSFNGELDGLLDGRYLIIEELKQLDEIDAMLSRNKADLDEIRMGTKMSLDEEMHETVKASLNAVKMLKVQRAV